MEPKPRDFAKRPDFNIQPPDFDPSNPRVSNKALLGLGLTTVSLITACTPQTKHNSSETAPALSTPFLELGTPRPNIEKGVERPVGGNGELVRINADDLSQAIGKMGKDWTIFTTKDEKGKSIIPLILFPDGTPTLGVGPTDFEWNSGLQLWQKQKPDGQTEIVIPEIIAPGGWDEKNQKAGPTLSPSAAFLLRENDNYRVGILYKPETLAEAEKQGIKLEGITTINSPGNPYHGYGIFIGVEKNITLNSGQQLTREENRDLLLKNPDGSYYRRVVYWDNVKNPNQLHQTETFAGPFEKQPTIPYPSDEFANQLGISGYTLIEQKDGKQEWIAYSTVKDQAGKEKQIISARAVLQKDKDGKETWVWQKTVPLALEINLVVPDPRITNPELFNLENPTAPIPHFVAEMEKVGIKLNPQDVVNNLEFRQIEGPNGEQIVIAGYTTTDSNNTPYTVAFIAQKQENGWRWKSTYPKDTEILGIKTGLSSWIEFTESWNPLSNLMPDIYKQFSINLIDGEAMWYIPYSPNSSLRPRRDNYNYRTLDKALNYNRMGIIVQSMIPSNSDFLPTWLKSEQNPEEVRRISLEHTQNVLSHIKTIAGDRVIAIGVASELTNNPYADKPNFWRQIFGITRLDTLSEDNYQWLVSLYQTAKDILPNAELYYSDFLIEFGGNKSEEVYNFVSTLRQRGAPIDAVAFQMHLQGRDFDSQDELNRNLEALRQQIRRYKQIGVKVIVSELDINMREVTGSSTYRNMIQSRAYYSIIRTLIEEEVDIISFFNPVDNQYNWLEQMNPNADPTLYNEVGLPKPSFYSTISALFQH
jgi:GH35 family endo-1,4-beta-xylanase